MLSISGACDVVEFRRSDAGVPLHGQEGLYQPFPVEYKSGSPRGDTVNALQLCAQAMCMEEMLCCDIPEGASSTPLSTKIYRTGGFCDWR